MVDLLTGVVTSFSRLGSDDMGVLVGSSGTALGLSFR